jgi:hypothetical protein
MCTKNVNMCQGFLIDGDHAVEWQNIPDFPTKERLVCQKVDFCPHSLTYHVLFSRAHGHLCLYDSCGPGIMSSQPFTQLWMILSRLFGSFPGLLSIFTRNVAVKTGASETWSTLYQAQT